MFAIGNPFGLSKTLTAGVVSGLNRGIPTPGGAIATRAIQAKSFLKDALLNPICHRLLPLDLFVAVNDQDTRQMVAAI